MPLQVRVIDLSTGAAKSALADGGGVATIGSWLLEAATAGKAKFAADLLACLDGLPIGMKALRTTGIGKTVRLWSCWETSGRYLDDTWKTPGNVGTCLS